MTSKLLDDDFRMLIYSKVTISFEGCTYRHKYTPSQKCVLLTKQPANITCLYSKHAYWFKMLPIEGISPMFSVKGRLWSDSGMTDAYISNIISCLCHYYRCILYILLHWWRQMLFLLLAALIHLAFQKCLMKIPFYWSGDELHFPSPCRKSRVIVADTIEWSNIRRNSAHK